MQAGGIAESLAALVAERCPDTRAKALAFGPLFYSQGKRLEILESAGLSPAHIADEVRALRAGVVAESLQ
jgi:transketolase C-terminal domain/subunit